MASYDVIVKLVDQTKASMNNIQSGLKNVERQAQKTESALGGITKAIGAIASSVALGKVVELAKSFGDLEARIRATSGSGAQTQAVMAGLVATANKLGISVTDAGAAFSILRANGIDASYKSLETWTKLAITSGRSVEDIADAIANAYQGSFGKISKATEDLIQVENKYGSFVIKFRGVVVDTVASSGAAVDAIRKFTEQNAAFADAFDAKSKGTTAAINRLNNAITGNVGFGALDKSIGGAIDKFTNFITASDGIGKAIGYVTKAVNFLGDNFETILTIVEIVGSIFLVGKLFQGLKILGSLAVSLGNSIRSLGYFFVDFGSTVGKAISYITTAWKSWYTQITGAAQPIVGVFDAVARVIGVTFGTIIKNIGSLLQSFAAPFTAVIGYVSGLFDPILDKLNNVYEGVKKFIGLGDKFKVTVGTPTGGGPRTPGQGPQAVAGAGVDVASGLNIPGGAGTTNPGVAANTFLQDIIGNLNKAKSELAPLEKALKSALSTGDLSLANVLFEELAGRAEKFGSVIQKDAALIQRDFSIAVAKTTEDLRRQTIEYENVALVVKQLANELEAESISLLKQNILLGQNELMQKKFANELMAGANALTERTSRLDDAEFQQGKFRQTLVSTTLDQMEATKTLQQYDAALEKGRITLVQYAAAVGQVDAALLNSDQVLKQALGTAQREAAINKTRVTSLEELTKQFKEGKVAADAYRIAASNLGGDTDAIDRTVNVYGSARDQIIEDNEFIKKSINGAAKTFSDEFTGAIMKGQLSFSSFKNFLTNILNDIAQRIIKRQFADPIADYMSGMASQVFGKGGIIPTKAGEGAVTASDSMTNIFTGLAGKTKEIFSGMSDGISSIFGSMGSTLMDSMSSLFSWIMDGIGSIGSNMGGLGSSLSGLFSGGGGGGGDLLGSVAGYFSGFFADGGTLGAGQYGIAGEAGPEMITGPATITPMTQEAQEPLIVNFSINALDTQSGTEFLIKNKAVISKVIEDAYNRRGKRGPITA